MSGQGAVSVSDWYDNIEEGLRDVVKLLRNNGVNTTCSCHHSMTVEAENYEGGEIDQIYNLLMMEGYDGFTLDLRVYQERDEQPIRCLTIQFHKCPKCAARKTE
jgi:hypothetical protein